MTLFDRSTQGVRINSEGSKLLDSAVAMQDASERFLRVATGASKTLSSDIRISANEVVGLYYLPQQITRFNQLYPQVNVEMDISNKAKGFNKRYHNVALRMFRPSLPDLVARRLADIELQFTASKDYLAGP
jgi:DNA-binding transcriptional LysR family regulator